VSAGRFAALVACLCLGLRAALPSAASSLADGQSGSIVDSLLERTMGFTASDLRAFDAGSAVIHRLDTPVREELAYVGAVFVDAPAEVFIERFRDIVGFERGPGIPQIGRLGSPPRIEDLEPLTLPAGDVEALQGCRPGRCDVKLSAAAMRKFQEDVDWSTPNAARQANEMARTMILDLVRGYQAHGNAALGHYDDSGKVLSVAEQFRALLASSDILPADVTALLAYLHSYPRGRPAGAEDFFYWTVVDFGLKPTVRVNHVTILPTSAGTPSSVAYTIAINQLYASHYFHTTLELRVLMNDDRRPGRRGVSLISITRSRNDGMTGFKGLFLRPVISRRSLDMVRGYLEHLKRQVERPIS